jgi:hypothetical protein
VRRETPPRPVGHQPEAGRARYATQLPNLGSAQPTAGDSERRHLVGAGGFASLRLGELSPVAEELRLSIGERYAGATLEIHIRQLVT